MKTRHIFDTYKILFINPYNERQQGDQKLFGIASEFKGGCRGQQKIHDSTHVDSLTVH